MTKKSLLWQFIATFCLMISPGALGAQGILKTGDQAPDFEIETLGGEKIKLSKLDQPVILLFSRANW